MRLIWFQDWQTTIFFLLKKSTSFSATTATTFNGCIWFSFRKQTTIFFLKKTQRLFRRQQLQYSMDAFDSAVSGNKRRFFFLQKTSTSFSATTATTFNGCIWFSFRKQTTIFSFKRVNVFFGDNSYDVQWMHFDLRLFLVKVAWM